MPLLHERVDVPEPETVNAERLQTRLVKLGTTERESVCEKPLIGAIVIVELPTVPVVTARFPGLGDIVKSVPAGGGVIDVQARTHPKPTAAGPFEAVVGVGCSAPTAPDPGVPVQSPAVQ